MSRCSESPSNILLRDTISFLIARLLRNPYLPTSDAKKKCTQTRLVMAGGAYMWITGGNVLTDLDDLSKHKGVLCLNFVDIYFTDVIIKRMEVAMRGRRFERIGVISCRGKLDAAFSAILDQVEVGCLKLDCVQISPSSAEALGDGIAHSLSLKCLMMQAMCMTECLAKALAHGLCRTTSVESIYWDAITTRTSDCHWVDTFYQALQVNSTLKHLGIARVSGMEPTDVFQSIQDHPSLQSLSLACLDGISSCTILALCELSRNIRREDFTIKLSVRGDWTRLQDLSFDRNNHRIRYNLTIATSTEYRDMSLLGAILQSNESIESLSLAHCGLDEDDISELASCLTAVSGLKHLNLHGNSLSSGPGCEALLWALQGNHNLESIDLPVVVEQKAAIDHLLDSNRAGRKILQTIQLSTSLWPLILQRAGTIDYTRTYPIFKNPDEVAARRANAIYHLLQGPATYC